MSGLELLSPAALTEICYIDPEGMHLLTIKSLKQIVAVAMIKSNYITVTLVCM